MVGDPTGKSATRPPLTREEVAATAKTYKKQAFKVLDRERTEVRYNSEWLDKLARRRHRSGSRRRYTVARMLERDDFKKRFDGGQPDHRARVPLPARCRATTRWRSKATSSSAAPISSSTCSSAATHAANTACGRRSS